MKTYTSSVPVVDLSNNDNAWYAAEYILALQMAIENITLKTYTQAADFNTMHGKSVTVNVNLKKKLVILQKKELKGCVQTTCFKIKSNECKPNKTKGGKQIFLAILQNTIITV